MKTHRPILLAVLLAAAITTLETHAQLVIQGSDGSDGALVITRSQVIDLGEAVTGNWDTGNGANAGKGVYDPEKWAVVFKYSSVTINEGATVTFMNHPSRAPVVWLVKGNVTIQGRISLDGMHGDVGTSTGLARTGTPGGPGGFRGNVRAGGISGPGFGPPGGGYWLHRSVYGNPENIPLMGGSGASHGPGVSGGGGGGAILIAAEGRISMPFPGAITATGGRNNANGAAGGAIRLIAHELSGTGGELNAGPEGIIRLEANIAKQVGWLKVPDTQTYLPGSVPRLWPAADAPTAKIVRIAGLEVPADPLASVDEGSDVRIQTGSAVDVDIETRNFPENGTVVLRVTPKFGEGGQYTAERIQGNRALATWRVSRVLNAGFSVLQVRAFVSR